MTELQPLKFTDSVNNIEFRVQGDTAPHEIHLTKKKAWDRAEELNSKSTTNQYWVEPAPFIQPTVGTH